MIHFWVVHFVVKLLLLFLFNDHLHFLIFILLKINHCTYDEEMLKNLMKALLLHYV